MPRLTQTIETRLQQFVAAAAVPGVPDAKMLERKAETGRDISEDLAGKLFLQAILPATVADLLKDFDTQTPSERLNTEKLVLDFYFEKDNDSEAALAVVQFDGLIWLDDLRSPADIRKACRDYRRDLNRTRYLLEMVT